MSLQNSLKDDSVLPLDDIEIVIGSDGNYVEIPFVPKNTGTHTLVINEDKYYKFHVIHSAKEIGDAIIDVINILKIFIQKISLTLLTLIVC